MQVDRVKFQTLFTRRAPRQEQEGPSAAPVPTASDSVSLSTATEVSPAQFKSALLAMATAASLGGIPAIAALAQEISKELVTPDQEVAASRSLADQLSSLPRVHDQRVQNAWELVASLSNSTFPAPEVVQSSFVDAQSDARGMYVGTASLAQDLADDSVLKFTLAHEEGHRVHRDSAGSAGLETLVQICKDDSEMFSIAFKALNQGRHQNEREADRFAAELLKTTPLDRSKVHDFLAATSGDLQHPDGGERAVMVDAVWA